jgi:hypothetical protein
MGCTDRLVSSSVFHFRRAMVLLFQWSIELVASLRFQAFTCFERSSIRAKSLFVLDTARVLAQSVSSLESPGPSLRTGVRSFQVVGSGTWVSRGIVTPKTSSNGLPPSALPEPLTSSSCGGKGVILFVSQFPATIGISFATHTFINSLL